jgi:hypothetical protein
MELTPLPPLPLPVRSYADVNCNNSKEYWDYENLSIEWG